MVTYTDAFTRADSAAGAGFGTFSDASKTWTMLSGTGHIASNQAEWETAAVSSPIAVVDGGNADFAAQAELVTNGGGEALYFRVVDASNYWRAFLYRSTATVQSGTVYDCVYPALTVEYERKETFVQYRLSDGGVNNPSATFYNWYPNRTSTAPSDQTQPDTGFRYTLISSTLTGNTRQSAAHGHTIRQSALPCTSPLTHDHNGSGGHTHINPTSTAVPVYSTNTNRVVRVQKLVAGVLTQIAGTPSTTNVSTVTTLGVVVSGSRIECLVNGTILGDPITDTAHLTATKAGIGRAPSSVTATTATFDNFALTPSNLAGAILADFPSDGTTTHDATPTLGVLVTDADLAQTLTVTFQVDDDDAFSAPVSHTAAIASPASADSVTLDWPATLDIDTEYHWRAKVNDGTGDSAWTATRSFYVNRTPVATNGLTDAVIPSGTATLTHGYSDADGGAQAATLIIRLYDGLTTYWTGTAWSAAETWITGPELTHDAAFGGLIGGAHTISFKVRDVFGTESAASATFVVSVHDLPLVSVVRPPSDAVLRLLVPVLTVGWVYSQAQDVAQDSYRVRVTSTDTATTYLDTDWVVSAAAEATYDLETEGIPLNGTVILLLDVRSEDGEDFEASDTTGFDIQVETFRPPFVINLGAGPNRPNRAERFGITEGDQLPMLAATIRDRDQRPLDLSAVESVQFRMRSRATRELLVEAAASIDSPTAGLLRYAWQAGDTDRPGEHTCEFELTFEDGAVMTLPNYDQDIIHVDVQERV